VGNGLAGTICSKTLRELGHDHEIDIYAEEKYYYYPRPNLIEFLAGNLSFEKLFPFSKKWYKDQDIQIHLEEPVQQILPNRQEIVVEGGKKEIYDILVLANGSNAFIPPIKGHDKRGLFTLRTLEDALAILDHLENKSKVSVIGGGLLGLEIARAMKTRGAEVKIIEFFPQLLPRQLDPQGATLLKAQIEGLGMEVHLELATEEILGPNEVTGLKFKNGEVFDADLAIIAAGVRANTSIASEAGLKTDKGIVVNEYLQTSHPKIFAAGDSVQFQGKLWGIIPASFEQARTAAHNLFSRKIKYKGTVPSNSLKIMDLDVTSIGAVNPEKGTCEEYRYIDEEKGIYKKISVLNGKLIGAIWMGTKKGVNGISSIISKKKNIEKWKDSLLEDNFDFSTL